MASAASSDVSAGRFSARAARASGGEAERLAALAAYCEAVARLPLSDRPAAITLRADVAEFFEAELVEISASAVELFHAIERLRNAVVDYLSRSILDLAPVMQVGTNLQMPSLYWAWRFYQDPNRSTQLVARNRVIYPSRMPLEFEALTK